MTMARCAGIVASGESGMSPLALYRKRRTRGLDRRAWLVAFGASPHTIIIGQRTERYMPSIPLLFRFCSGFIPVHVAII